MPRAIIHLDECFDELNAAHFDGFLDWIPISVNDRLRSSAGRFIPQRGPWWDPIPTMIEIAGYLWDEPNAIELIRDTLGHEMIHYWLWVRKRPYGHTPEFYAKMRQMGVSRYNPVPIKRPYKWLYRCAHCQTKFPTRRKSSKTFACGKCCKLLAEGRYDARFKLVFEGPFTPDAG